MCLVEDKFLFREKVEFAEVELKYERDKKCPSLNSVSENTDSFSGDPSA